jgi:hypothetical protein
MEQLKIAWFKDYDEVSICFKKKKKIVIAPNTTLIKRTQFFRQWSGKPTHMRHLSQLLMLPKLIVPCGHYNT